MIRVLTRIADSLERLVALLERKEAERLYEQADERTI